MHDEIKYPAGYSLADQMRDELERLTEEEVFEELKTIELPCLPIIEANND